MEYAFAMAGLFESSFIDFIEKLILALFIGILIGVEREQQRAVHKIFAGVRTFSLVCIVGMLAAYISNMSSPWFLAVAALFIGVFCTLLLYVQNVTYKTIGMVGPLALFCTFLIGILIGYGHYHLAIVSSIVIAMTLIEKQWLHSFASNLNHQEISDALRFLAVVFILYPVVPADLGIGISPRTIISIVLLVSTVSFASFIALKHIGTSAGIIASGILGGLVNSGATIMAMLHMSKDSKMLRGTYIGIMITLAAMLARNLIVAFISDNSGKMLLLMLPPQLMVMGYASYIAYRGRAFTHTDEKIEISSPFALVPAAKFALAFAAISVIAAYLKGTIGIMGIYSIALGGVISSAAVVATMGSFVGSGYVSYTTAAAVSVLASMISIISKIVLIRWFGGPAMFKITAKSITYLFSIGLVAFVIWFGVLLLV